MFANRRTLEQHFEKHGHQMGYLTPEAYLQGALTLINSYEGTETFVREDGATLYYREITNEFAILAVSGIITTYYRPDRGWEYWRRKTRRS